jgi:hypothetical protein
MAAISGVIIGFLSFSIAFHLQKDLRWKSLLLLSAIGLSITLLTSTALLIYCGFSNQPTLCNRNPILISGLPFAISLEIWLITKLVSLFGSMCS